jgi:hypothetical protein
MTIFLIVRISTLASRFISAETCGSGYRCHVSKVFLGCGYCAMREPYNNPPKLSRIILTCIPGRANFFSFHGTQPQRRHLMKFNRKLFWRLLGVFAVLDLCLLSVGCAGSWETEASSVISLLGPALQALVAILAAFGEGVSTEVMAAFDNWSQQAQSALINIKALIASYQTAAATAQPGILNEIQAALSALTSNLGPILTSLHITDPTSQAKFTAGVEAVTAFLASLAALIPAVASATTLEAEKALAKKATESTKQFRSAFNSAVGWFGPQYTLK